MGLELNVWRHGDRQDRGPGGEYGFVVVGKDPDSSSEAVRGGHAETVHCGQAHPHTIECVKRELQTKTVSGKDKDGADVREGATPQEMIQAWVAAREKEAAEPKVAKAVLPKKTVTRNGKPVEIEDTSVAL